MTNVEHDNKTGLTIKINPISKVSDDDETLVDAKTVGKVLLALPEMMKEFHSKNTASEQLLVKARPFAKGSFEISLELILFGFGAMPLLLSNADYIQQTIKEILARFKEFIEIKIKLAGEAVQVKGDNNIIINNSTINLDDKVINVINSDNHAESLFRDAINELAQDSEVESLDFQVGSEKETIASIKSSQFKYFTSSTRLVSETIQEKKRVTNERTRLKLKQPDLAGTSKWNVYYDSKTIAVKVKDDDFIAMVKQNTERFGAGDELDVDFETTEIFDTKIGDFRVQGYAITKVHQHLENKQEHMTFFDEAPR
ncbi:MAG: hypothetical protein ACRC46_15470 [Thermoguttaceae bacterium]